MNGLGKVSAALRSPRAAWIQERVATYGLFVTFLILTTQKAAAFLGTGYLGLDLRIYRAAALAAIQGGDPWLAGVGDYLFAAPPPTLIVYLPAAIVAEPIAIATYGFASLLAAVFVIRRLRLPIWWLLFPPLSESLIVLNPDVFVIALLLCTDRLASLAVVVKVYALVPLVLQRRWIAVVIGGALSALSIPLWLQFFGHRDQLAHEFATQTMNGSAWGSWVAIPTVIALIVLRGRGASWLAVPALWPFTQLHYSCLAMPAARRSATLAFLLSFAIPLLPAVAVIVEAIRVTLVRVLVRAEVDKSGVAGGPDARES